MQYVGNIKSMPSQETTNNQDAVAWHWMVLVCVPSAQRYPGRHLIVIETKKERSNGVDPEVEICRNAVKFSDGSPQSISKFLNQNANSKCLKQ